jgi:WD40 repeat protein
VVTTSEDGDGRTWDVASGEPLETLRGHFALVSDASFSPDSSFIVTSGPVTAGLWDTTSGRLLLLLQGHDQLLTSASFSPNGRQILTSSWDRSVRVYDCEVCLPIDDLVTLAEERLDRIGRELTDEEREELFLEE